MKYQNVKIKFEQMQGEEYLGEASYIFGRKATKFLLHYYKDEVMDYSIREALTDPINSEKLHVYDTDAFLSLLYCLTEYGPDKYKLTATYGHIIWLFHDLAHARWDCDELGVSIYQQ